MGQEAAILFSVEERRPPPPCFALLVYIMSVLPYKMCALEKLCSCRHSRRRNTQEEQTKKQVKNGQGIKYMQRGGGYVYNQSL